MEAREFEFYVQNLIPEIFSFVRVLADDDAAGAEVIRSAIEGFHVGQRDVLERLAAGRDTQKLLEAYRMGLFRHAYLLAKRDFSAARAVMGAFGSLGVGERAVLYLYHRTAFSLEAVADVLDCDTAEAASLLYGGREKLLAAPPPRRKVSCFFSRQVPVLVGADAEDGNYRSLREHVFGCPECAPLYEREVKAVEEVARSVPKISIPRALQRNFEGAIGRMLETTAFRKPKIWERFFGRRAG